MMNVGFAGWRGMVGSVLLERLFICGNIEKIKLTLLSTSIYDAPIPDSVKSHKNLSNIVGNANDINLLAKFDCIISTQGSDYTEKILPILRDSGFAGFWIDASSSLRLHNDAVIVLDPINHDLIITALNEGVKNFIGGNCTVSIMLMALSGLLKHNLVKWVSSASYQSISGGGANKVKEFIEQNKYVADYLGAHTNSSSNKADTDIQELTYLLQNALNNSSFPVNHIGTSLWGNVLPWIDLAMDNGQTKEEFKAGSEANKILGLAPNTIPIDGICVRVGTLRSHALALTVCLNDSSVSVSDLTKIIQSGNEWVKVVENNQNDTLSKLTPSAVCGTLCIAAGRIHKLNIGEEYLNMFVVGDQLLWGAAEPLRRTLDMICQHFIKSH